MDSLPFWIQLEDVSIAHILLLVKGHLTPHDRENFINQFNMALEAPESRISCEMDFIVDSDRKFRIELETQSREVIEHFSYGILSLDDDLSDVGCSSIAIPDAEFHFE